MTTQTTPTRSNHSGIVAGTILILVGLFSLAAYFFKPAGELLLGALALVFVAAGLITRKNGLVIPGGILSGIAMGAFLVEGPFKNSAEMMRGGMFFFAFAGGFVLITLLSLINKALGAKCTMVWPLIPAGVMILVGGLLVAGNLEALNYLNIGWPIILIAIGAYLLLRRKEMQE